MRRRTCLSTARIAVRMHLPTGRLARWELPAGPPSQLRGPSPRVTPVRGATPSAQWIRAAVVRRGVDPSSRVANRTAQDHLTGRLPTVQLVSCVFRSTLLERPDVPAGGWHHESGKGPREGSDGSGLRPHSDHHASRPPAGIVVFAPWCYSVDPLVDQKKRSVPSSGVTHNHCGQAAVFIHRVFLSSCRYG